MQELIKAAQSGNTSAWNILYKQHYPWLYAVALRLCGNSPEAKDAVQDTFIQAYLKLHQLKDDNSFPAWLKTILVRCCYRYLKPDVTLENNDNFKIDPGQYWEDEINQKMDVYAQQARLYEVLALTPETLRSVVLLRYFSGWKSYEQMAQILCVPVGTIRSRLNESRKKMIEIWTRHNTDNQESFREAEEWNHFYSNYFGTVHYSLHSREKFTQHLDKNLHLIFSSGKTAYGRKLIEREIDEDLFYGNSFGNIAVMTSGSISIVEVKNINSKEYPTRCPESGIFVLYRNKHKISRLNLHNSH